MIWVVRYHSENRLTWLSLLNPATWYQNLTGKMRWTRMGDSVECLAPGELPDL